MSDPDKIYFNEDLQKVVVVVDVVATQHYGSNLFREEDHHHLTCLNCSYRPHMLYAT